ncbi:MAG: CAP domain-containing protein [Chitinophagia bacterium]|nr:CAP domain-containing protein [Chitinophagia bacterium]
MNKIPVINISTLLLIITLLLLLPIKKAKAMLKPDYSALKAEIIKLVNRHRDSLHLAPLTSHSLAGAEAQKHTENMANKTTQFGHDGFSNRVQAIRKKEKEATGFGENVAFGAKTAQEVFQMWLNSPDHRKNIEGNFTHIGIGIAASKAGTLYYTQIFVKL